MPRILTFITVSGPIDVFGVIECRSKYRAVAGDATNGVYTFIVHLVWRMIRTPILPLSPGRPIFSLIRRNISSFWDEYFISLTYSCDVDIASTRRLASACRSLSHSTRVFQNVVRLSRSTVCETCSTVCETCSTVCETCSEVGSI